MIAGRLEPVIQRLVCGYLGRIPLGIKGNNLSANIAHHNAGPTLGPAWASILKGISPPPEI